MKKLGELLVKYDLVSPADLEKALELQKHTGLRIGDQLKAMGVIRQDEINWIVTKQYNIPYIILNKDIIDKRVFESFPFPVLMEHDIVPVREEMGVFYFAVPDPSEEDTVQVVSELTNDNYSLVLAEYESIRAILQKFFPLFPFPLHHLQENNFDDANRLGFISTPGELISFFAGFSQQFALEELSVFPSDDTLYVTGLGRSGKELQGPVPPCWNEVCKMIADPGYYPFFYSYKGSLYACYFMALSNQVTSGFLMKKEEINLFDKRVFLQYNKDLWHELSKTDIPSVWVFSLSYYNSLACFHIMYKMFFRRAVIFNQLCHRTLPVPYLFFPPRWGYPFKHCSVLKDSTSKSDVRIEKEGKIFLIDHQKSLDIDRIDRPLMHVYDDGEKNIRLEFVK